MQVHASSRGRDSRSRHFSVVGLVGGRGARARSIYLLERLPGAGNLLLRLHAFLGCCRFVVVAKSDLASELINIVRVHLGTALVQRHKLSLRPGCLELL